MKKKKLLIWCDFIVPTGFGIVAKNLFANLHEQYEVHVVAINYRGDEWYDANKWFVYSCISSDVMNIETLHKVTDRLKPELILLFQDHFNISKEIVDLKKLSPNSKIISYFPIDSDYIGSHVSKILEYSNAVITYTDYAIDILKKKFPTYNKHIYKLYHGVDSETFYPLPDKDICELRKLAELSGKFLIINNNRFQPRKAIPLTIRAYSMFAKGYKVCRDCGNWYPLHLNKCDLNGCTNYEFGGYAKYDIHLYLHMNDGASMGSGPLNSLKSHFISNGFTNDDYPKLIKYCNLEIYTTGISDQVINNFYNIANVNLTTTLGEGFGLNLIESAAVGTPSIAPNNSCISEVLKGTGYLARNESMYAHPNDAACMRPIVSVKDIVEGLEYYYKQWQKTTTEKIKYDDSIELVKKHYDWESKRIILTDVLKKVEGD
jgi:glycosyltransferase involved in cell wall biosynthesis